MTAKQPIQTLVAAGVCTNPLPKDAQGVMYQCHSNTYNADVWIRAFPTAKAMKRDLDSHINPKCRTTVSVVMGPNWWMNPHNDDLRASITAEIGGMRSDVRVLMLRSQGRDSTRLASQGGRDASGGPRR